MLLSRRSERKDQLITRRGALLTGMMTLPFALLLSRLYYLQVITGQKYKLLSEKNRLSLRLILPERGLILDRIDKPLAVNEKAYRLIMVPEQARKPKEILSRLATLVNLSIDQQKDILKKLREVPSFVPVSVREFLTFDEVAIAQVNMPDLPGVDVEENLVRHYPYGPIFSHLLGYIAPPDKNDLQNDDSPLLKLPDFRIGRRGLEQRLDTELRGQPGSNQVEVNALGRSVRIVSRQPEQRGEVVRLSIVAELQQKVWELLQNYWGSVVVLDTLTGEVLAAVSHPAYDPNEFVVGLSTERWRELQKDPAKPMMNRAFQGVYAPGSTYKMVVALAALEEGVVRPSERIDCQGHMTLGDRRFHCWNEHGHGPVDLRQALAHSCDIYFYHMGQRLGVDTVAKYAHMLGLGQPTGIELAEEEGLIPTRAWKRQVRKQPWVGGEDLIQAIGQGYVLATPLQLAVMTARIATGKAITPRLIGSRTVPVFGDLPFDRGYLETVRQGMEDVVQKPYGTGARARDRKYLFAGKTGTSQVVSKRRENHTPLDKIPFLERTHALFVGYGPSDHPRIAVSVLLEHAGSGGGAAAPLAREVMVSAMDWLNTKGRQGA